MIPRATIAYTPPVHTHNARAVRVAARLCDTPRSTGRKASRNPYRKMTHRGPTRHTKGGPKTQCALPPFPHSPQALNAAPRDLAADYRRTPLTARWHPNCGCVEFKLLSRRQEFRDLPPVRPTAYRGHCVGSLRPCKRRCRVPPESACRHRISAQPITLGAMVGSGPAARGAISFAEGNAAAQPGDNRTCTPAVTRLGVVTRASVE